MQPAIGSVLSKSAGHLAAVLTLLLLPACILLAPQIGRSQNVPPVTGIEIVGFGCPYCGEPVNYLPGRKIPAICPHCKRSLVQPAKPKSEPIRATGGNTQNIGAIESRNHATSRTANNASRSNGTGDEASNALKSTLKRSQVDAQILKQLDGQLNAQVNARENGFEKEKSDLFTVHTSVRLRYEDQTTNRSNYSTPKVRKLGPLANLSDRELEQRYDADEAEFQTIVQDAKRRGENVAKQQVIRDQAEADVRVADANLADARLDAGIDVVFAGAGKAASAAGYRKTAEAIGTADDGRTVYGGAKGILDSFPQAPGQNHAEPSSPYDVAKSEGTYNSPWSPEPKPYNPESSQNFKSGVNLNEFSNVDFTKASSGKSPPTKEQEAEWNQAALSVETPHPQLVAGQPAPANNPNANFNTAKAELAAAQTAVALTGPAAGLAITSGKILIEDGVALENRSIDGKLIYQASDYNENSAKYASFYTQRMRELKKDEEDIRAEQAQRAETIKEK